MNGRHLSILAATSIQKAMKFFQINEGVIVTLNQKDVFEKDGYTVKLIPAHEFLIWVWTAQGGCESVECIILKSVIKKIVIQNFIEMRNLVLLVSAICILNACSGLKSIKTSEYSMLPVEVGKLVTADLLSRPEFMMYKTPEVTAVHYAEACAG